MYAALWQRHRTVAAYMGGGPGSGIYKSYDEGETWKKLTSGLPKSNMGKIGLDISRQNNDILYAAIELNRRTGGVYKSTDGGENWKKVLGGGEWTGVTDILICLLYTSPSPRDRQKSRMPSSA